MLQIQWFPPQFQPPGDPGAEDRPVPSKVRAGPTHLDPANPLIFHVLESSLEPHPTSTRLKSSLGLYRFLEAGAVF